MYIRLIICTQRKEVNEIIISARKKEMGRRLFSTVERKNADKADKKNLFLVDIKISFKTRLRNNVQRLPL